MAKKTKAQTGAITASKLRENVYQILDQALATGEAVSVYRHGQILRIEPPRPPTTKRSRLANLPKRKLVIGDDDSIVHLDWSAYWKP